MPDRRRVVPQLFHLALIIAGVAAVVWALTAGLHPTITCHGVEQHPGDVCHRLGIDGSDHGKTQSYEAAVKQKRDAVPVIAGLGVLAAGFGAVLLAGERRRNRPDAGSESSLSTHEGSRVA